MNEEEKKAIDFLKETNFDYLEYDMCVSSVKIISSLVERLQKENEELKKLMAHKNWYTQKLEEDLFENASNYVIKKQKVKDKIEELNRKIDKSIDNSKGGLDEEFIEKAGELLAQKRILQKLLEESEDKL